MTIGDIQEGDINENMVEDLLIRGDDKGRGYPGRGGPPDDRGPPDDGGPPDGGRPPGNGRPPRRPPRRQGLPGPPGPPGPVHPIIVQQPQVTLDTTTLENTFGTVGQSMLQLARAQDQTNRYKNTFNKDRSICKRIQGPFSTWPLQLIRETLTIFLLAYLFTMVAIGKISFLGFSI